MTIIFRVTLTPICIVEVIEGKEDIANIEILNESLTENVFPKALKNPSLGDLLMILKIYAGLEGENLSLKDLMKKTGGNIPFVEFKQNVNIIFTD